MPRWACETAPTHVPPPSLARARALCAMQCANLRAPWRPHVLWLQSHAQHGSCELMFVACPTGTATVAVHVAGRVGGPGLEALSPRTFVTETTAQQSKRARTCAFIGSTTTRRHHRANKPAEHCGGAVATPI